METKQIVIGLIASEQNRAAFYDAVGKEEAHVDDASILSSWAEEKLQAAITVDDLARLIRQAVGGSLLDIDSGSDNALKLTIVMDPEAVRKLQLDISPQKLIQEMRNYFFDSGKDNSVAPNLKLLTGILFSPSADIAHAQSPEVISIGNQANDLTAVLSSFHTSSV